MSDEEINNEGTPAAVPIHEASDEDLNAFLEANTESEVTEPETAEPQEDTQTEASAEEVDPPQAEEAKEEPEPETPKKEFMDEKTLPEQPSKEEIEKVRRQIEQQRLFLARQSTEIGELRKQLRTAKAELSKGIEDRYTENPAKAVEDTLKIKEIDGKLAELDNYEGQLTHKVQAQEILSGWVKPDEWDVEMMTEILKDDGFPEDYLKAFRTDPVGSALPETLVQLAKRGKERRHLGILAQATKSLMKENEELKLKLKEKPKEVLRNINSVARQSPGITGANGSGKNSASKASLNPATMTNEQLEEFLKANT